MQGLCLVLKSITSVFATFNAILFAFCQSESSFKSLIRVLEILEIVLWILIKYVSSTKWKDCENFMELWRSLIYIKKEGEPVETPEVPHIEDFVFQSEIQLLLEIVFCEREIWGKAAIG